MKKAIILATLACGLIAPQAIAQRFALKAYDNITLGNSMSLTTSLPGSSNSSASNAFGMDFGYTFWRLGGNSLEINAGLSYSVASATFKIEDLAYNYAAPAFADEDGNPYQRYTQLTGVSQKLSMGYLNIPIYLQYQYRATNWLGIYANAGIGFGFKVMSSDGSISGKANTYGEYQEYNQLVIKADYLNDLGLTNLDEATLGKADIKGFNASVMCGAGFEFYVAEPVSFEVGVQYNAGLTNVFGGRYDISTATSITAETAPVTYTVAEGQKVKALSDYVTKSRLNPLSLHLGVAVRF